MGRFGWGSRGLILSLLLTLLRLYQSPLRKVSTLNEVRRDCCFAYLYISSYRILSRVFAAIIYSRIRLLRICLCVNESSGNAEQLMFIEMLLSLQLSLSSSGILF